MKTANKIYWKELVEILQKNEKPENVEIDFRNEMLDFKNVSLLNRFGFNVPKNLINYDDENIDFSDDPDITDEDIETGKISWSIKANFNIEPEIKQWIKTEKIEINSLIPQLMKNFYETVKQIKKNAAI
jgi:hypothetical protein